MPREMPIVNAESSPSSASRVSVMDDDELRDMESTASHILTSKAQGQHLTPSTTYWTYSNSEFSPSVALLAMKQPHAYSQSRSQAATSSPPAPYPLATQPSPYPARPVSISHMQSSSMQPYSNLPLQEIAKNSNLSHVVTEWAGKALPSDPYKHLRRSNIGTKPAWTVIPAEEGFRILQFCKSMSTAATAAEGRVPCYNRETLFDEEWQMHMKDVHGLFLLWPGTWMRRIEVLDLDAFGGDIVSVNGVIMDS